jgi:D-glycero-D-manno-heptose 1,7-bisphosphate phosphatase
MKLVILDRDGTLNDDRNGHVKSVEEWSPLPGALKAVARLNQAGWRVVLATNQSGLGRGLYDMGMLNTIHQTLNEALSPLGGRIDAVFFCPHAPEDDCDCRKPRAGLFKQIGERLNIDLAAVPTVGNLLRHLQAGVEAGCAPHLVRTGRATQLTESDIEQLRQQLPGLQVHADLNGFVDVLLSQEARRHSEARAEGRR